VSFRTNVAILHVLIIIYVQLIHVFRAVSCFCMCHNSRYTDKALVGCLLLYQVSNDTLIYVAEPTTNGLLDPLKCVDWEQNAKQFCALPTVNFCAVLCKTVQNRQVV